MTNWITFVQQHHEAIIIDNHTIRIPNIGYTENGRWLDHTITKINDQYQIKEYYHDTGEYVTEWAENSIRKYLGY